MKIGVVADTHSRPIPKQLLRDFKAMDLIVHAGDFCTLEDLKIFEQMKNLKAVFGNMDDPEVRKKLPEHMIFDCDSLRIGVYHGEGPAPKVIEFAKEKFKCDKVHCVIFGHTHRALNKMIDGVLYFNPGSPNDIISAPYCSYGILEIKDGKLNGKIIKVKG